MVCALWHSAAAAQEPARDPDVGLRTIVSARIAVDADARTIDVPVDRSITSLSVSVESLPGITATLFRPGGAPVTAADRGVSVSDLKPMDLERNIPANLRLYTIARPQPGVWQIALSGTTGVVGSMVLVNALGDTPIGFDVDFVRKQEGVHGGYFEIDGMPLAGAPATARARLWRGSDEATFRAIDDAGVTLRNLPLRKGDPEAGSDDFLGTFELPNVPFRVVMNAVDASGALIQRQHPARFRAQPVALFLNYGRSNNVEAGTNRPFTFAVANVGTDAATFALTVEATIGQVLDLSSSTVSVQPNTSATPSFTLAIPANADRLGLLKIRLTATKMDDAAVKNSATFDLDVAPEDDADYDFVANGLDNCRDVANNDQRDANRNGIGDACDPADGGTLTIRGVSPESGPAGTVVTLTGTGFNNKQQNFVLFNGLPALTVASSATELVFTVPEGVAPGPTVFILNTDKGFAMGPKPFIVRKPR